MKRKRPNTLDLPVTNMDMTDSDKVEVPVSVKVCNRFGPMCQFLQAIHYASLTLRIRLDRWRFDWGTN